MSILWDLFGAIGLAMILAAFYLEHKKEFQKQSLAYNGLNLMGSLILLVYAVHLGSVIFIALNLVWVLIAGYFILKRVNKEGFKKDYSHTLKELNNNGEAKSLRDLQ